jgi:ATP-dependent DNA helicase RecQ
VLRGHGFHTDHYHAGLEAEERTRVQDDFVAGRTQAVVATTAFGMGIDKPDVRLVCLVNYPDSLEGYVQMVGRAGRDDEPSQTLLLASTSDATALRRFAVSDVPTAAELRSVYRVLRDADGLVDPDELSPLVAERDARVLVGMLEQAGLLRRDFDQGRLMRIDLAAAPADARERVDALLERARLVAESRADRIVAFAETRACRHEQVAAHFGEEFSAPCGACDVCAPLTRGSASIASPPPPLPDEIGEAIVDAVASLTWPLGRRSLLATLRGSLKAPPSARRSAAYRMLAAATDGEVRRWLQLVELSGALVEVTTPDGFRVLHVDHAVQPPQIPTGSDTDVDEELVTRLRSWRLERSQEDAVPAYVVLHDATLRELAALRPQTLNELAGVKGFGPVKLERYGDDLLAMLAAT